MKFVAKSIINYERLKEIFDAEVKNLADIREMIESAYKTVPQKDLVGIKKSIDEGINKVLEAMAAIKVIEEKIAEGKLA